MITTGTVKADNHKRPTEWKLGPSASTAARVEPREPTMADLKILTRSRMPPFGEGERTTRSSSAGGQGRTMPVRLPPPRTSPRAKVAPTAPPMPAPSPAARGEAALQDHPAPESSGHDSPHGAARRANGRAGEVPGRRGEAQGARGQRVKGESGSVSDEEVARQLHRALNGGASPTVLTRRRTRKQPLFYTPQLGGYGGYHGVEFAAGGSEDDGAAAGANEAGHPAAAGAELGGSGDKNGAGTSADLGSEPSGVRTRAASRPAASEDAPQSLRSRSVAACAPREAAAAAERPAKRACMAAPGSGAPSSRDLRAGARAQHAQASNQAGESGGRGEDSSHGEGAEAGYAGSEEGDTPRGAAAPDEAPGGRAGRDRTPFKRTCSAMGAESPGASEPAAKAARTQDVPDAPSAATPDNGCASSPEGNSGNGYGGVEDGGGGAGGCVGEGTSRAALNPARPRKIPKLPMVQHDGRWYRARLLKDTAPRVLLEFTGLEDAGPIWLPKDSARIWRGSYKGRDWRYLGDGAWEPKPKGRARRPPTQQRPRRTRAEGDAGTEADGDAHDDDDHEEGQGHEEEGMAGSGHEDEAPEAERLEDNFAGRSAKPGSPRIKASEGGQSDGGAAGLTEGDADIKRELRSASASQSSDGSQHAAWGLEAHPPAADVRWDRPAAEQPVEPAKHEPGSTRSRRAQPPRAQPAVQTAEEPASPPPAARGDGDSQMCASAEQPAEPLSPGVPGVRAADAEQPEAARAAPAVDAVGPLLKADEDAGSAPCSSEQAMAPLVSRPGEAEEPGSPAGQPKGRAFGGMGSQTEESVHTETLSERDEDIDVGNAVEPMDIDDDAPSGHDPAPAADAGAVSLLPPAGAGAASTSPECTGSPEAPAEDGPGPKAGDGALGPRVERGADEGEGAGLLACEEALPADEARTEPISQRAALSLLAASTAVSAAAVPAAAASLPSPQPKREPHLGWKGAWKKTHRKYGAGGPPARAPGSVPPPQPEAPPPPPPERAAGRPARKIRPPARTADGEGAPLRGSKQSGSGAGAGGSSMDEEEPRTPASRPARRASGRGRGAANGRGRGQGRWPKPQAAGEEGLTGRDALGYGPRAGVRGGAMRRPAAKAGVRAMCEGGNGPAAGVFGALLNALGAAEVRHNGNGAAAGAGLREMGPPACRPGNGYSRTVLLASSVPGAGPGPQQRAQLFGAALAARWHFAAHARILAARAELFGASPALELTDFGLVKATPPVPLFH